MFLPRPLTAFERGIVLDVARGLTAPQSARKRDLSVHQVYRAQRDLKTLLGAATLPHAVALAIAYGDIGHFEITDPS